MAEGLVPMDLRMIVATWPEQSSRGAVRRFCAVNGVSTSWFYEVRRRARVEGPVAAVVPRSRRPRSSPRQTRPALEDLAVLARKQLVEDGWDAGPLSVRFALEDQGLPSPSRATLARIFTRRGLVVPEPRKRPHASYRKFVFPAPNQCWQLDGSDWRLADGSTAVIMQVEDDHSRMLLASRACPGETSVDALAVVETAIGRAGVPQRFLSDNGTALNPTRRGWTGLLVTALRARGVQTITSSVHHPQTCGKNERVHSTLKRWLRARPPAATLADLQGQLDEFDDHYNHRRRHQSLGGRTPAQAWAATPVAPPPKPPPRPPTETATGTTSARRRADNPRTSTLRVAANGNVGAAGLAIQVGREHARSRVIAVIATDTITLFDERGDHLRTIHPQPGRRYYGNGRPRGGDHKSARWRQSTK